MKPLKYKTQNHPATSSTLCRMPHLNNKKNQKYKPNNQQAGVPPHSALPIRGKSNINSTQISPYMKLTQTTGPTLRRAETKRKIESNFLQGKNSTFLEAWEKETSKTKVKK